VVAASAVAGEAVQSRSKSTGLGFLEDMMSLKSRRVALTIRSLLLALLIPFAACNRSDKPSIRVFASPDDASNALQATAQSGDQNALLAIFGPDSKELIFSGDPVQDKNVITAFAAAYGVMHRWRKMPDGSEVLLVGADNFPFPIPLKKDAGGQWYFDTAAGKHEVLARRIGRNELAIIEVCRTVASAQAEYFSQLHDGDTTRHYAMKFISDPGKQNGLYWKSADGQPESPLGPLAAFASSEGYGPAHDAHTPFHGYYFHMLQGQSDKAPGGAKQYLTDGTMTGGFAFVAYPAQYGNSGIMTFIINQDGVLLQKNLGQATAETASSMTEFDPDTSWSPVEP
jgi:hypothetical protein